MEWQPTDRQLDRAVEGTRHLRDSSKPQWVEARQRLEASGISPRDAVLSSWEAEGEGLMCGVVGLRDGRVINFCVRYGLDRSRQPLEKGIGWITSWTEIPEEEVGLTSSGHPNAWAEDRIIAREVFNLEG
jgi:hypothetical protein